MIRASFRIRSDETAFTVKGHAGAGVAGNDIVCAAVSSAAYMAANTVTEILGVQAQAQVKDGYLRFSFSGSQAASDIVRGLKLHLEELASQYPDRIKVTTEV